MRGARLGASQVVGRGHLRCAGPAQAVRALVVVVDDFDVVAVGIEHERGVVAGVIAGALARLAVASVSGPSRVGVKPAHVVVIAREGDVDVPVGSSAIERGNRLIGRGRTWRVGGLALDGEAGRGPDRRVERGRRLDIGDTDRGVINVAAGPVTVAVDGFEAVAGAVFETCRVVVVAVIRTRAGRPVIGQPGRRGRPGGSVRRARGSVR